MPRSAGEGDVQEDKQKTWADTMSRGRAEGQSQTHRSSAGHLQSVPRDFLTAQLQRSGISSSQGPWQPQGRREGWRAPGHPHGPAALPTSQDRAALSVNAHSLSLQQQAHASHSSPPNECLNHTMDSQATGFCSSGSSSGNEGNYHIPVPLLTAINLSQKNGPWRQLLRAA